MSMVARCPKCATTFLVTPGQLKARAGKVRCGSCKTVFNALEHLIENTAEPAAPKLELQWPAEINRVLGASSITGPPTLPVADAPAGAAEARPTTGESMPAVEALPAVGAEPSVGAVEQPAGGAPAVESRAPFGGAESGTGAGAEAVGTPATQPASGETDAALDATSARELRSAPGYNRWAETALTIGSVAVEAPRRPLSPAARVLWPCVGVLAACALVLQASYYWRTEIAARQPGLRPFLAALCAQFACTIELPREVQHVTIDSSNLLSDPERPGTVLLEAILRNAAPYAQAHPALELTLTDASDRPLVRRVLLPDDYLDPARPASAPGFAARSETTIRLWLDTAAVPAAGYRLYLFYP